MFNKKIGDRIGAIKSLQDEVAIIYGFGSYICDCEPPENVIGSPVNELVPKILLDNGMEIWCCEAYCGSEEIVKKLIGQREVVEVSILDYRK